MDLLSLFVIGFAPGLFWLWRAYGHNRYRPDHKGLVLRTFLIGIALAVPVVLVERAVQGPSAEEPGNSAASAAFVAFVVAGLVEETGKFLVVRATMYRSPYFDEPLRGLVFSAAVALGFASIENVKYMLEHGAGVILLRSVMSTPGHVMFASVWGYALGVARQREDAGHSGESMAFLGLAGGVAMHGLYDYFLMVQDLAAFAVTFILSVVIYVLLVRQALRRSPHRDRTAAALFACPGCGVDTALGARFCPACGAAAPSTPTLRCGGCSQPVAAAARFCGGCGSRMALEG